MAKDQTDKKKFGYIYRCAAMSAEPLKALLKHYKNTFTHGWTWTYSDMYTLNKESQQFNVHDQGRVSNDQFEIRWRKTGDVYDVLLLTISKDEPEKFLKRTDATNQPELAFESLKPAGNDNTKKWEILPNQDYLLLTPLGEPDKEIKSTYFMAPNGSTQFVALIG